MFRFSGKSVAGLLSLILIFYCSFCSADEKLYIAAIQKLINTTIPVMDEHPYVLDPKAKREVHRTPGKSKHRPNRKSAGSKKNKKRWY